MGEGDRAISDYAVIIAFRAKRPGAPLLNPPEIINIHADGSGRR